MRNQYSAVEHLAASVGLTPMDLMDFTSFFDDSGTHKQSSTAVAACVLSRVQRWKHFTRAWDRARREFGFDVFHMADFATRNEEFKGWTETKQRNVLTRLIRIIAANADAAFGVGVSKRDYEEVFSEDFREEYVGRYHYTFVVRGCCGLVGQFRNQNFPNLSLQYVFDRMGKGKGEIMDALDRAKKSSKREQVVTGLESFKGYSFQDKADLVPLQAADILAWTTYQQTQRIVSHRKLDWIAELAFKLFSTQCKHIKMYCHTSEGLAKWAVAEMEEVIRRMEKAKTEKKG